MTAKIHHFQNVSSTMDRAKQILDQDFEGNVPALILADEQDSGRGRHGRVWVSQKGNVYLSILTRDVAPDKLSQYALMWGCVMRQVVAECVTPDTTVQCKWPNDILIHGRKVGGLLIERYENQGQAALIVGIGVNIKHCPEQVQFPATSLKEYLKQEITPMELAKSLYSAYETTRQRWQDEGFDSIRTYWLEHAWSLNRQVKIRQNDRDVIGVLQGVNDKGAVEICDAQKKVHTLYAGDLFLGEE